MKSLLLLVSIFSLAYGKSVCTVCRHSPGFYSVWWWSIPWLCGRAYIAVGMYSIQLSMVGVSLSVYQRTR